jgi:hypothetical protein
VRETEDESGDQEQQTDDDSRPRCATGHASCAARESNDDEQSNTEEAGDARDLLAGERNIALDDQGDDDSQGDVIYLCDDDDDDDDESEKELEEAGAQGAHEKRPREPGQIEAHEPAHKQARKENMQQSTSASDASEKQGRTSTAAKAVRDVPQQPKASSKEEHMIIQLSRAKFDSDAVAHFVSLIAAAKNTTARAKEPLDMPALSGDLTGMTCRFTDCDPEDGIVRIAREMQACSAVSLRTKVSKGGRRVTGSKQTNPSAFHFVGRSVVGRRSFLSRCLLVHSTCLFVCLAQREQVARKIGFFMIHHQLEEWDKSWSLLTAEQRRRGGKNSSLITRLQKRLSPQQLGLLKIKASMARQHRAADQWRKRIQQFSKIVSKRPALLFTNLSFTFIMNLSGSKSLRRIWDEATLRARSEGRQFLGSLCTEMAPGKFCSLFAGEARPCTQAEHISEPQTTLQCLA